MGNRSFRFVIIYHDQKLKNCSIVVSTLYMYVQRRSAILRQGTKYDKANRYYS